MGSSSSVSITNTNAGMTISIPLNVNYESIIDPIVSTHSTTEDEEATDVHVDGMCIF